MSDTLRTRINRLSGQLANARTAGLKVAGRTMVLARDDDVEAAVEAMDEVAELQDAVEALDRPDRRRRHLRSVGGGR